VTEGVGYARYLWRKAPRTFQSRTASSNCAGEKGFCKNIVPTGMGSTALPDMMMMFM
jgi:hypothetical protein